MRYSNLLAEMARNQIAQQDIAILLGKTVSTVNTKINGKYPFTLDEAMKIQENLFKDKDIPYLFEKQEQAS
ncbi:MAG TPA: XRE family transcriptional regulator [Ruminiclostridium sp.]